MQPPKSGASPPSRPELIRVDVVISVGRLPTSSNRATRKSQGLEGGLAPALCFQKSLLIKVENSTHRKMIRGSLRHLRLNQHLTLQQPLSKYFWNEYVVETQVRVPHRERVALLFRVQEAVTIGVVSISHAFD